VGNVLRQPWGEIWANPCFTQYREGMENPRRCPECPGLEICQVGCLKDPAQWSDDTGGEA
jgi:radical SAM protein with 4Fe4S-binding SPASM domain